MAMNVRRSDTALLDDNLLRDPCRTVAEHSVEDPLYKSGICQCSQ